jgi:hypothetical protein
MKLRRWSLLLGLLMALCLSAPAASASFKVTEKACEGTIPTLCIEKEGTKKSFEAEGTETYVGKLVAGTKASLKTMLGGEEIHIECGKDESTGQIVQLEPLVKAVESREGVLHFSECSILGSLGKKCTVPPKLSTNNLLGITIDEMPLKAGIVRAESGTNIIVINFQNNGFEKCPATILGLHPVTGEDLCITSEAETPLVIHTGECTAEGSIGKLFFAAAENPAVFEALAEVELSGGNKGAKWEGLLG